MAFGDNEILREEENVRLLKIEARNDREVYCVIGGGRTRHFEDYEDALDEFNERWMAAKFREEHNQWLAYSCWPLTMLFAIFLFMGGLLAVDLFVL